MGALATVACGVGGVISRMVRRRWNVARRVCWIFRRTLRGWLLGGGGIAGGSMMSPVCLFSLGSLVSIFGGGGGVIGGGSAGISASMGCWVAMFVVPGVAVTGFSGRVALVL